MRRRWQRIYCFILKVYFRAHRNSAPAGLKEIVRFCSSIRADAKNTMPKRPEHNHLFRTFAVIRHRFDGFVRGNEIDAAVTELLAEMKAERTQK